MKPSNEHECATLNPVRGTVGAQWIDGSQDSQVAPKSKQPRQLGVNDTRVWERRIRKRGFKVGGDLREAAEWSLSLKENGRRVWFNLGTANKGDAANKAREIGLYARANGLAAAEAKFKRANESRQRITVGDWITGVEQSSQLSPKTMLGYATALRQVAAGITHAKGDDSRFDYRKGGAQAWRERLDSCHLDRFTPQGIATWQRAFVANAGPSPEDQAAAKRSCNSYVRQARALFSPTLARKAGLTLPDPVPFKDVELLPEGTLRYTSRIDVGALIAAAQNELRDAGQTELWKAFLLVFIAGLRRAEADCLLWDQVDFERQVISIKETWAFKPKTAHSCGDVSIEPEFSDALKATLSVSPGDFVLAGREPRPNSKRPDYRADRTWKPLLAWLRGKGITGFHPVHTMRKEAGAAVTTSAGIFAASKFLRHGSIAVTDKFYADHKARVTVNLGGLIKPAVEDNAEEKKDVA